VKNREMILKHERAIYTAVTDFKDRKGVEVRKSSGDTSA
jgi:hypothetical protein